jgi:branched-subunit amino acid transport protein
MMPLLAILVLAAGTYAFRLVGPVLRHRISMPSRVERLLADAATVLLVGLVATSALVEGQGFAGWARPAGVLVAAVLALCRLPFPVVVVAAASTTAVLRLLGVP